LAAFEIETSALAVPLLTLDQDNSQHGRKYMKLTKIAALTAAALTLAAPAAAEN